MARETADSWDYISFPIDSIMYGMFQSVLLSSCFLCTNREAGNTYSISVRSSARKALFQLLTLRQKLSKQTSRSLHQKRRRAGKFD